MSLRFCVLASGSKANSTVVSTETTSILFDCGLSGRQAEQRLREQRFNPRQLSAIVISHEHIDHVAGVAALSQRYDIPVVANSNTFDAAPELADIPEGRRLLFQSSCPFSIGDLTVHPFAISHDASEPVAFRVTDGQQALGIVTDLGYVTEELCENMFDVRALVLEANHDLDMLESCPYPREVKTRIRGKRGHLSNHQARDFLSTLRQRGASALHVVIAAHISEKSNTPELALRALHEAWGDAHEDAFKPRFVAALQHSATEPFEL